jgi:hypothetical protein
MHFVGKLAYPQFISLLQLATVHVYLTYPFVLSWSLLEAMSGGCSIIASDTAPVREVIEHDVTGRLVDFFDTDALATEVCALRRTGSCESACLPRHVPSLPPTTTCVRCVFQSNSHGFAHLRDRARHAAALSGAKRGHPLVPRKPKRLSSWELGATIYMAEQMGNAAPPPPLIPGIRPEAPWWRQVHPAYCGLALLSFVAISAAPSKARISSRHCGPSASDDARYRQPEK